MSLDVGKTAIALLGLLAYKNRDKIGDLLTGRSDPDQPGGHSGGLGDLIDRFRGAGAGDRVDSWIGKGANQSIERRDVEGAIDAETLDRLAEQTGMSRDELLDRLTREIPDAVDRMTPEGRMPHNSGGASTASRW